jgi:RNA polymerase sigma factor (sigma-70 family)
VARVRAGDERAFELVFDRYHRSLLAFCRRMLASNEEAEDALQHTFMAAYRALRRSDRPILLKAWLYTIARNRCLSILRARREQVAFDDGHAASDGLAADIDRRAELRGLLADLEQLPEEQRAALVLFELPALGDVHHGAGRKAGNARVIEDDPPAILQPADFAAGPDDAVLEAVFAPRGNGIVDRAQHARVVVGMDPGEVRVVE